jgi:hypothetical protein
MTYEVPPVHYLAHYLDTPDGWGGDYDEGFQIVISRPWSALRAGEGVNQIGVVPTNDCGYALHLPEDHPARLSNPMQDIVDLLQNTPRGKTARLFHELQERQIDAHDTFGTIETAQPKIPFYCFYVNDAGIGDTTFMDRVMYMAFTRTAKTGLTYTADLERDGNVRRLHLDFSESGDMITTREITAGMDAPPRMAMRSFYRIGEWTARP